MERLSKDFFQNFVDFFMVIVKRIKKTKNWEVIINVKRDYFAHFMVLQATNPDVVN